MSCSFTGPVIPEGVTYDVSRNQFYVGDLLSNFVWTVDASDCSGIQAAEPLTQVPNVGTAGLFHDAGTDLIYTSTADIIAYVSGTAGYYNGTLVSINPSDGAVTDIATPSNPTAGFLNDLVMLDDGSFMVTDSVQGSLRHIMMDGTATDSGAILSGPNGIENLGGTRVIVVSFLSAPILSVVDTSDNTVTEVVWDYDRTPVGGDGLRFLSDGTLAAVMNFGDAKELVLLGSDDDWSSVFVISEDLASPPSGNYSLATCDVDADDNVWGLWTDLSGAGTTFYINRVEWDVSLGALASLSASALALAAFAM
jgi:hypothetical protein